MLFVPPSMPFMDPVPEAAADHSSNLQGAITDLSLVSVVDYDPPFSSALRNNITLSWSAPNDNGSPITYYVVQAKGTSGNWVKLDHMEPTVTTYTHTTVVNIQIQYRVWAVGPDGCHGNTTTYYDTLPCNEGNILSVVSVYGGGIYPPIPQCDNEYLDECGYFPPEYFGVNLSFESLNITSSGGSTTTFPGDTIQITPTIKWEYGEGSGIAQSNLDYVAQQGNPKVHGGITFPDGSTSGGNQFGGWWTQTEYSLGALSTQSGTITPVANTWTVDADTNNPNVGPGTGQEGTYHGAPWPVGEYTVTFTIPLASSGFSETNLSDNVITGTFTVVAPADTTPPVVSLPSELANGVTVSTADPDGVLVDLTEYMGLITPTDDVGIDTSYDNIPNSSKGVWCNNEDRWNGNFQPQQLKFTIGTTTITCIAKDTSGNPSDDSASFTVTVNYTPPEAEPEAELTMNSPNISEFIPPPHIGGEHKVKYNPTGSFNFDDFWDNNNVSSCLSIQVLKPDGTAASITYDTACVQHFAYNYNFEGYINDAFNASGWTMNICNTNLPTGHIVCVEQNFTINFAFLDASADETLPVLIIHSANSDGSLIYPGSISEIVHVNESVSYGVEIIPSQSQAPTCNPTNGEQPYHGSLTGLNAESSWWIFIHAVASVPTQTITCTATDAAGNTGTASLTVNAPAASDPNPPTITASAYLNATSTTGRTLTVSGTDIGTPYYVWINIYKDGIPKDDICGWQGTNSCGFRPPTEWWGNHLYKLDYWQLPIPADWESGSYDIIWTASENSGTIQVTIPAPPASEAEPTPTLIASAYLNATSPTGRTLEITAVHDDIANSIYFSQTILSKDGSVVDVTGSSMWNISLCYISCSYGGDANYQIPIPTVWAAGVYLISWSASWWDGSESNSTSGSTTVTIPALPGQETFITPTLTASAYLNATSPTGRTLEITAVHDDTVDDVWYQATLSKDGSVVFPTGSTMWNIGLCYMNCGPSYSPNYQISIPTVWAAGEYLISWSATWYQSGSYGDSSGITSVTIPTPPASEAEPTPTITASAYLNATSPTGRTLEITAVHDDTMNDVYYQATLSKDGSVVFPTGSAMWNIHLCNMNCGPSYNTITNPNYQMSIPTVWAAGEYLISWSATWYQSGGFQGDASDSSGITSVTIPTLSSTSPSSPTLSASECFALAAQHGMTDNDHLVCGFPFDITVVEGERVAWFETKPWVGIYYHTITSVDGFFDMVDMGATSFLPSAWNGTGTYNYYDALNPSLTGTITVLPAEEEAEGQLTINSVNISEFYTNTGVLKIKYNPTGSFNFDDFHDTNNLSSCLSVQVLKPDGTEASITYDTACVQHFAYNYNFEGYINDAFNASGWTMKICSTGHNVCVEQNFTINFASLDDVADDTTLPVFTSVPNESISISNSTGAIFSYQVPSVTDDIGVVLGPTCTPPSGSLFPVGTTLVTCTAYDLAGNQGTTSFSVTVNYTPPEAEPEAEPEEPEVDTTSPVLVVPNVIPTQTYDPAGKIVYFETPYATDNGVVLDPTCTHQSGSLFPVGTTTVTCTAVDASGNTTVKSFTITIVYSVEADTTSPAFMHVDDVEKSTTNPDGIEYNYAIPQVYDNIGVTVGPTCNPESGSTFPIGKTDVVCTAIDAAGNVGTTTFSVTVINPNATGGIPTFEPVQNIPRDDEEPIIADVPNGKQLYFIIPTATDDGVELPPDRVFCTPSPGFLFPVGDYIVACTAIDEDGNQGSVTFTVTVIAQIQQQISDQITETSITALKIQGTVGGESVPSVPAGGLAYFTTSLATNSTGNAFITIYVQDSDDTALGVGEFKSVIGIGDSDLTLGFRMPSDAVTGMANIYVNVWADEADGASLISTYPTANIQIIGLDPADLGAFNYSFAGLPDIHSSPPGFSAANVVDGAKSYWKGSPPVDTFLTWSEVYDDLQNVNSYAESKVPFGNDFVTDLKFNEVLWDSPDQNLQIHWVKDYGAGVFGVAPISTYNDVLVDVVYMSLGDSNCGSSPGVWQPYSEKFLTETLQHEMGHVIGFAHDENPNSLMYFTNSDAFPKEYGIVEDTIKTTGWHANFVPICTSRDQADFNYHVSVDPDDEIPLDVYFVPSIDEYDNLLAGEQFSFYEDCYNEGMFSVTATCNNVEQGSGLIILMPPEVTGVLTDVTFKLQENFDGFQTLSNVATTQEAPIIPTSTQSSKVELLEISDVESEHESVFMDGTNYVEITDTTMTQDIDEFSIVGWIEPDFSKSSQVLTIVSKYKSFDLFLAEEYFQLQGAVIQPQGAVIQPRTLSLSLYDGTEWFTIPGHTEVSEDWHHVAVVVDGSVATLYLDTKLEGKLKLEKKITLGAQDAAKTCHKSECFTDVKMSTSDTDIVIGAYISKMMLTNQYGNLEPKRTVENNFSGIISSVEIFSDAFTKKQILQLYERDKNYYKKDMSIESMAIGTESPALSDSECLDLAKERGLEGELEGTYTLVCQFPFDVVIPLNSSVLWMETLPSGGGPFHIMKSVDDLFTTTLASFAVMDFYEPDFAYGVYEYLDVLNESLTGRIIVAKQLEHNVGSRISTLPTEFYTMEPVKITRHSADTACAINNSCYEPFAISIDVRDEVIWKNIDSFSHSVTSGTPEDGPDGAFDSGLIPPMRYFSHTFSHTFSAAGAEDDSSWQGEGIYEYYCTFHPWMQGMVIVGEI